MDKLMTNFSTEFSHFLFRTKVKAIFVILVVICLDRVKGVAKVRIFRKICSNNHTINIRFISNYQF